MPHTVKLTDGSEKTYLSCAETAKLVRAALKARFPRVKFSVRSSTYSGGASIRVGWTDGPTTADVDAVLHLYEGATFDGMTDLKSYHDSILVDEDGTPRVVSFGSDFVQHAREISDEWRAEILDEFERIAGVTIPRGYHDGYWETRLPLWIDRDGSVLRMVDTTTEYVADLVHRYTATHARD